MRILVAEDDAPLADFICEELQREQFAVQKVADGVEAQELASNQNYDLVILDLTLPAHGALIFCVGFAPKSRTFRFSS